jgi:hypothetical protein
MRRLLFLALALPVMSEAQLNRSAREFASEQIHDYIVARLFKDKPYKAISYGEIKSISVPHSPIYWTIDHDFEITDTETAFDKKTVTTKVCRFIFYLDKKMKVLRADSYEVERY